MNKLYLLLIFILFIPIATAINITSGVETSVYKIDKCNGPIKIKVTSEFGIKDNEIFIKRCSRNDDIWECECVDSFDVSLYVKNDTKNIYDMNINYYIQYKYIEEDVNSTKPSIDEVNLDDYFRKVRLYNIYASPEIKKRLPFSFNIETKNGIIVGISIVLCLVIFFIIKIKKYLTNDNKSIDVLNYKNTKDDELDEILNQIK
jgi:hypothetical protein